MSISLLLSSNEHKKKMSRCYNEVHKEIYGVGVTQLRIEAVADGMIMFLVKHQRVVALRALEDHYTELKQSVDSALHHEFKLRFQKKLSEEMDLPIQGVLRDYDPASEWACTLIIMES
ncbi:MAG: DUF2294 domain-containing protein [Gorillibacterium sp.]|nr:DUF2294 domain-containing protein [Gorillibacterium sp.]